MTSHFSTEIGRLRTAEMVARGIRYQEVNRLQRAEKDARDARSARGPRSARLLAFAAVSLVTSALSLWG